MPNQATAVPAFVSAITGDQGRAAEILGLTHPDYAANLASWTLLIEAFEGQGGFLTGAYLDAFPAEDKAEFQSRQQAARYHNYLESLVDLYARFVFTQGVQRQSKSEDFNAWLRDVDGAGLDINGLMRRVLSLGLVTGHAGVLIDKTADEAGGPAVADEASRPVATVFSSVAIPDWRFDAAGLSAVKLLEAAPSAPITEAQDDAQQYLIWTRDGWARFTSEGELAGAGVPGLGLVPFVVFRPKPAYTSPMIGRALVPNANVIKAIYNRDSEEDHVLRTQAFSVLTVSVPEGGNVQQAKEHLGSMIGATKALVVQGEIDYKTPDTGVPQAIRENSRSLIESMYRAAHVRVKGDGLQAESGESIRLQYTELNEALQGISRHLQQVEQEIARCYFAWQTPTPEAAQAAYEAAQVEVTYPNEFFLDAIKVDLEAWDLALKLDLGQTMEARIKRMAVRRLDPDITPEELAKIDADIERMAQEPAPTLGGLDSGDPEAQAMRAAAEAAGAV